MYLSNLPTIIRMICDKNVRNFLKQADQKFSSNAESKNYSKKQLFEIVKAMFDGEKIVHHQGKYVFSSFLPPVPSGALKNGIRKESRSYSDRVTSKRDAPVSMYMAITKRCPYRCAHCSAAISDGKDELTTNEWQKIIADLQNMGVGIIGLTGGEPLLRSDVEELISSIDDRSVPFLFTSGAGLTKERALSLKRSGLFAIGISLDSYIKEVHNQRRGGNKAFDLAIAAMKNAKAAGLYTMAQIVVYKHQLNRDYFFKYLKFVKSIGVHEVRVLEPIRCGELIKENDDVFYTAKDRKLLIELHHEANRRPWLPKVTTFAYTESYERFGCGAGVQHSYINEKGELFPCDFLPMSFGNVVKEGVSTLWSKMSEIVGIPKPHCFAQVVNHDLWKISKGELPLDTQRSTDLCVKYQAKEYPLIYKMLQQSPELKLKRSLVAKTVTTTIIK